jgi:hypothetical protein
MTNVSNANLTSPSFTTSITATLPPLDPADLAKSILASTKIGESAHHIDKIEARLDAIAAKDPANANQVRDEVMKRLSPMEQGELMRVREGEMRIAADGKSFNYAPKGQASPTQEDWIARAKADGNPDYLGYVKLAQSEAIDAVKKAMDDVYNGVATLPVGDTGYKVGDGLDWIGNQVSGIDREAVMNGVRSVVCPIPAMGPNLGVKGYAGLGGGVNAGAQFDLSSGQISFNGGVEVGVGVGGGVTLWKNQGAKLIKDKSLQGGYGGSESGVTVGVGVNTNLQLGPVAGGAQFEIAGTASKKDPSLLGRTSAQVGPGGIGLTANANLSAYGGYTTPALYDLGCKK